MVMRAGLPSADAPLVDPATGIIRQSWLLFLQVLTQQIAALNTSGPVTATDLTVTGSVALAGVATSSAAAAGPAAALPATPQGYVSVSIDGTERKIAYYA